jgi:hypothetical protein
MYVTYGQSLELSKGLLEAGVDTNAEEHHGGTALRPQGLVGSAHFKKSANLKSIPHIAMAAEKYRATHLDARKGQMRPSIKDNNRRTPLFLAEKSRAR